MIDTEVMAEDSGDEARETGNAGGVKRERSTVEFPYNDLDEAVKVACAIHKDWGQGCTADQLAASLGKGTITSGAFRLKISTARIFGLIEMERGQITLTSLGREIVDPDRQTLARARAFLHVPLYRAVFGLYKGQLLPRAIALENEFIRIGVSVKQKDKARQIFQRAAEQAGFFAMGRDRLIAPAGMNTGNGATSPVGIASPPTAIDQKTRERPQSNTSGGGGPNDHDGGPPEVHPAIHGLLLTLPTAGIPWASAKRDKWISALTAVLGLVYPDPEE